MQHSRIRSKKRWYSPTDRLNISLMARHGFNFSGIVIIYAVCHWMFGVPERQTIILMSLLTGFGLWFSVVGFLYHAYQFYTDRSSRGH